MRELLLLITFFLVACSGTDTGNPTISGTDTGNPTLVAGVVRDSLGNPAPASSIWVRPQVNVPAGTMLSKVRAVVDSPFVSVALQTDSTGAFEIAGLSAGDYVMVVIANNKSGGRLLRFTLTRKDSLNLSDSLQLKPLQDLSIPMCPTWQGRTVLITELDLSYKISSDTLRVPLVPQGVYTIESKGDTTLWKLDSNIVSIIPFPLDTTHLSSSSQSSSTSQAFSSADGLSSIALTTSSSSEILSSTELASSSSISLSSLTLSSSTLAVSSSVALSSSSMLVSSSSIAQSSSVVSSSSAPDTLVVTWSGGSGALVDPRDTVTYKVTNFAGATWFAENLRVATATSTCDSYDPNAATTCNVYGRFYTFADASNGICPRGWRLPTAMDWSSLIFQVGGASIAGYNLKSSSGWYVNNGTDSFGMSMLPAGTASTPSSGTDAYFWADTTSGGLPGAYHINTASTAITLEFLSATEGVSVRCVR